MTNDDVFTNIFDIFPTELWCMSEKDLLEWLNAEYDKRPPERIIHCRNCKRLAKIIDEKSGVSNWECIRTWSRVNLDDFCSYAKLATDQEQCLPMKKEDFSGYKYAF